MNERTATKCPTLKFSLNNKEIVGMLDTGCSNSIIKYHMVPKSAKIVPCDIQLNDCSNQLTIFGETVLEVKLGDLVFRKKFIVVSSTIRIPVNVIFGMDLFTKFKCKISFEENKLFLCDNLKNYVVDFTYSADSKANTFVVHAIATKIPALSRMTIKAYSKAPDGDYVLNKASVGNLPIFVAESLVTIKNCFLYAQIVNLSNSPVMLCDNQILSKIDTLSVDNTLYAIVDNETMSCNGVPAPVITEDNVPSIAKKVGAKEVLNLLNKYNSIISLNNDKLGTCKLIEVPINTESSPPIFTKQFQLPHSQKPIIKNIVKNLLSQDIITSSDSPWNSPLFLVKKKSGEFRPIIDFRKINEVTVSDPFPLARIQEIFQSLHGSKIFSTIDLNSGYHQMNMKANDAHKTAFTTDVGRYHFLKCPFGLKNAPNVFSKLMNIALSELLGSECLLYMDDIIVHSDTIENHINKIESIFKRLQEVGLTIKLEKCNFLQSEIKYLGHNISHDGLSVHSDQFEPVLKAATPKTKKELQKFLGFISYFRSFIPNFAEICEPMIQLLKNNSPYVWSNEVQTSFDKIKAEIIASGKLIYPDFSKPFIIKTDASLHSIGAALCQERDEGICPIYFISRSLNKVERRYSVTKLELLAISYALKKFRPIILGYPCTLYTDHKAIIGMFKKNDLEPSMSRWVLQAQEYDLVVKFIPGVKNILADYLSRIKKNKVCDSSNIFCVNMTINEKDVGIEQRSDKFFGPIVKVLMGKTVETLPKVDLRDYVLHNHLLLKRICSVRCGVDTMKYSLCVPDSLADEIIQKVHSSISNGHMGFTKTLHKLKENYFILKLYSRLHKVLKSCDICKKYKGVRHAKSKLEKYPIPHKPWSRVGMDFVGPLTCTNSNNKYILGFCDYLTRYTVLYPLPDKSAQNVALTFKTFIAHYDVPDVLVSDRAAEFCSSTLHEVCKSNNVKKVQVMPYSPHSNGLIEAKNKQIKKLLRIFCGDSTYKAVEIDWDLFLPDVQCAINNTFNRILGDTPHYVLFGYDRSDLYMGNSLAPREVYYNYDDFTYHREQRGKSAFNFIKTNLEKNIDSYTKTSNKKRTTRVFHTGDRVFVERIQKKGECAKFIPPWKGPGYITEILGPNKVKVDMNGYIAEVHVDNILSRYCNEENSYKNLERKKIDKPQSSQSHSSHRMKLRSHVK